MEEDDEGNVSLGPDLTEGHRRGYTGAQGWPAAGGRERVELGRGGEEEERVRFLPPGPILNSLQPAAPVVPAIVPVLPPARDFQMDEPLKFPRGRKYRYLHR